MLIGQSSRSHLSRIVSNISLSLCAISSSVALSLPDNSLISLQSFSVIVDDYSSDNVSKRKFFSIFHIPISFSKFSSYSNYRYSRYKYITFIFENQYNAKTVIYVPKTMTYIPKCTQKSKLYLFFIKFISFVLIEYRKSSCYNNHSENERS